MAWPDLTPVLGSIPWAVIGAVATRMYMPERATADLDIAISARDAEEATRRLAGAGWQRVGDLAPAGSSWTSPAGERVDVLEFDAPWIGEALGAAANNRDPAGLPIMPLPHLVLTKLRSARVQDVADISRMLGEASEAALDKVRAVVKRYAPDDADDVDSLAELGRVEFRPSEQQGR